MGTDILGRDVAAGMIHGSRQSLLSGLASTILGGTIGVILGMMAGFYGSRGVKVHIIPLVLGIIGIGILFFYLWYSSKKLIFGLAMVMVVMFMYMLHKVLNASKILPHWKTTFPIDTIVLKAIEIRKSIPPLFLILALLPIFASPSVWNVVVVLSILIWSDFARYSRAETMNIANTNYIERVLHSGFSGWYILTRHILPNILPTLMVLFCFSVGACILAESSISFLGIGVAATDITWGTILAEGRKTLMWWMIVFPGIAIFLVIWSLNMIVNYLQNED
jgi:peptide/nickel transport system permease protein